MGHLIRQEQVTRIVCAMKAARIAHEVHNAACSLTADLAVLRATAVVEATLRNSSLDEIESADVVLSREDD